jgi:N6-adenosine-specific RNA methylase IME4
MSDLVEVRRAEIVQHTPSEWADRIRPHLAKAVEGIVMAGKELAEAKVDLGHGSFEAMVRQELHMDPSTAARFMAISRHGVLSNLAHAQDLPTAWTALYELSRLSERQLEVAMKAGNVHPDMERKEAKQLVAAMLGTSGIELPDKPLDPPKPGTYRVITADPPWQYGNSATRGSAKDHYPTMTVDEICKLADTIEGWVADNCHLYLWTTNGFLREAFDVMDAWGFTYKTCLTWVKPQIGMGNYFRVSTEHVLFGVRGKLPIQDRALSNWFESPRGKHSEKPEQFYSLVETASPGPYLELFARVDGRLFKRDSWTFWGNEAQS